MDRKWCQHLLVVRATPHYTAEELEFEFKMKKLPLIVRIADHTERNFVHLLQEITSQQHTTPVPTHA